jgi:hypothetical protein
LPCFSSVTTYSVLLALPALVATGGTATIARHSRTHLTAPACPSSQRLECSGSG